MTKSLPVFLIWALLLFPQAANAQTQVKQASPPDASEFNLPGENSVTVAAPSPIAEVPAAPIHQGGPPPLPWQTGASAAPIPFAPSTAPATLPPGEADPNAKIAPPVTEEHEEPQPTNTAVLQGLNKVTGHVSRLEGPIGTVLTFDNLEIIPRRCWKSPPDQQPENAALLEIREIKIGEAPKKLFLGWMFSSSPGLSGLEHPVYDVTIVACEFHENPENIPEPLTKDNTSKDDQAKVTKAKTSGSSKTKKK